MSKAILALASSLILVRALPLLLRPRLWAEEATVYLPMGLSEGWRGLMAVRQGYYSLLSNLGGVLGAAGPLEAAAFPTTVIGFVSQYLPVVVIVWGRGRLLGGPWSRAVLAAFMAFLPTAGLWANSLSPIFHLAAALGLVLVLDPPQSRYGRRAVVALAALAALSSPPALFLLPVAAYRGWKEGGVWRVVTAALMVGFALQGVAHLAAPPEFSPPRGPVSLVVGVKDFVLALFVEPVVGSSPWLRTSSPLGFRVVGGVIAGLWLVTAIAHGRDRLEVRYALACMGAISIPSVLLMHSSGDATRYMYPVWPLLFGVMLHAAAGGARPVRMAAISFLVLAAAGQSVRDTALVIPGELPWREEVQRARAAGTAPHAWPNEDWALPAPCSTSAC